MVKFIWSEEYDLGNSNLNQGVKNILNTMNQIYIAYEKGSDKIDIIKKLRELENVSFRHFKMEEEYMKIIDYPSLIHHQFLHQEMLHQLRDYTKSLMNWDAEFTEFFFEFLRIWIVEHILHIDKDFCYYANLQLEEVHQSFSLSRKYSS